MSLLVTIVIYHVIFFLRRCRTQNQILGEKLIPRGSLKYNRGPHGYLSLSDYTAREFKPPRGASGKFGHTTLNCIPRCFQNFCVYTSESKTGSTRFELLQFITLPGYTISWISGNT